MKRFNEFSKINESIDKNVLNTLLEECEQMVRRIHSDVNIFKSNLDSMIEDTSVSYRGLAYKLDPIIEEIDKVSKELTPFIERVEKFISRIPDDETYNEIYEELDDYNTELNNKQEGIENLKSYFEEVYDGLIKSEENINNIRKFIL